MLDVISEILDSHVAKCFNTCAAGEWLADRNTVVTKVSKIEHVAPTEAYDVII